MCYIYDTNNIVVYTAQSVQAGTGKNVGMGVINKLEKRQ